MKSKSTNPETAVLEILQNSTSPRNNFSLRKELMEKYGLRLSPIQMRQVIHTLRINTAPNIVSGNSGYYLTHDKTIIQETIKSLEKRASSIQSVADAMRQSITKGRQLKLM